ncbi:MAG: glutamate--tRNA ligase [Armatimonadota bacterium]
MAPAPTGRLHIGTARTTLYNWLFARHHGGTFVLRIEDSDKARSSEEFTRDILDAIRWLGLDWDEGPEVGGPYGPYFQSQKLPRYREVAHELVEAGMAYPCYCTPEEIEARRKEMQAKGLPPRYDRRCRGLTAAQREQLEAAGRPKAIRFITPDGGVIAWRDLIRGEVSFENALLDDFVLLKADGFPTYLLAVVVDDHDMRISHILRGEDLISATPRQLHIYQTCGWPAPEFAHIPLILGPDRSKMSKRHGATAVTEYREQGYLPEAFVNFIALLGWSPGDDREKLTRQEMIEAFSIEGIGKSGAVFDKEKLDWMNGVYLREMPDEPFVAAARPFILAACSAGPQTCEPDDSYLAKALLLEKGRAKTLAELPTLTEFFFREPDSYDEKGERKWFRREGAAELLAAVREALASLQLFDEPSLEAAIRGVAGKLALQPGPVIHTTRLAVTGRTAGPGLFETMEVLGRERVVARLARAERYVRGL